VYPNGNRSARDTHVSIYVELLLGFRIVPAKYLYRIEMVNRKNLNNSCSRMDTSEFKREDCWGYNKFISLAQLPDGFLIDDSMEIKFSVIASSFAVKCEDQSKYIESLEKEYGVLHESKSNLENNILDEQITKEKTESQKMNNNPEDKGSETRESFTKENGSSSHVIDKVPSLNMIAEGDLFQDLPPLVDDADSDEDKINESVEITQMAQKRVSATSSETPQNDTGNDDDIPPLIHESFEEEESEEEEEEEEAEDMSELFPGSQDGFDMFMRNLTSDAVSKIQEWIIHGHQHHQDDEDDEEDEDEDEEDDGSDENEQDEEHGNQQDSEDGEKKDKDDDTDNLQRKILTGNRHKSFA